MRAFARIRISSSNRDEVLSRLRSLREISDVAPFREEGVYGVYVDIPEPDLVEFGDRLSSFPGIIVEYYITQPDLTGRFEGTVIRRTIVQFEQIASALIQTESKPEAPTGMRLRLTSVRKIVRDLKQLKLDWVAEKLESPWLIWYIFADLPEEHEKLAIATGIIFQNLSLAYHSSSISASLQEIGDKFVGMAKADRKEYPIEFDAKVKDLRNLVDTREMYVEAAKEGGFGKALIRDISVGRD